jgi:hypothetical protein
MGYPYDETSIKEPMPIKDKWEIGGVIIGTITHIFLIGLFILSNRRMK